MTITAAPIAAETMRHAMITSQLRTNSVDDQRVVAVMAQLPREDFVPPAVRAIAYRDTALPVGNGRAINPPMPTGRLLSEADLTASDRVLLIGAAGGYTAAVLARIVAAVVAVEQDTELCGIARRALAGDAKVRLVEAPLADGFAEAAPYDVLFIDGAVDAVPDRLIDQLGDGGRIVAGLIDRGVTRLASGRKTRGGYGLTPFADVDCVPLPGFARSVGFRF